MIKENFRDRLVSIGHGPHQSTPLISVLLVDKSARVEKCSNDILVTLE
jgi:hypothetical protein